VLIQIKKKIKMRFYWSDSRQ